MPLHLPPTMAEREAELAALQSAFDEYIASSRELEEELDAELAKMQEKLAESSAANAALSLQLENIAPQLTSLENSLGDCRKQLKEEQQLKRVAEQAQDVAEAKVRELQDEVHTARTECDAVTEELAFKDAELEEAVMKMEIEKEQLREELEDLRADLIAHVQKEKSDSPPGPPSSQPGSPNNRADRDGDAFARGMNAVDDAYAKKLEDELELVTEQLIDTQKRYNSSQDELSQCHATIQALETARLQSESQRRNSSREPSPSRQTGDSDNDKLIRHLKQENADRLEDEQHLRGELEQCQQELELTREELQAAEDDARNFNTRMDNTRAQHREEISRLQHQLSKYEKEHNSNKSEFVLIEKALQETLATSAAESLAMKEEIDNLNKALKNSKGDYNTLLEEFETISSRFDEACQDAERKGREGALDELKRGQGKEVGVLKDQFLKLEQENKALQEKLDQAELTLSSVQQTQDKNMGQAQANNEILQKLQAQLVHAKEDLVKKDKELGTIVKDLEDRLDKAEQTVHKTEKELSQTKAKLAEADARLIVLKREKERAEGTIPKHNRKQKDYDDEDHGGSADDQSADTTDYSESRDDISRLSSFGDSQNYPRGRYHGGSPRRRRSRSSSPPSVTRLEYRLSEEVKKYKVLQREHEELKDQKRMGEVRIKRLEEDLRVLQNELISKQGDKAMVTHNVMRLSSLASTEHGMDVLTSENSSINRLDDIIESRDFRLMAEELRALNEKTNSQREYNAQLLSKMLSLQGNIQVYCRIRPMTISEVQRGYKGVVEALSETEVGCFDARTNKWKSFAFDRVWGPDQSQQSVFQDVEPVALSVVDGYNACIFAYGQTGSGKTFTMEGSSENNQFGISYRTIQKIFHLLNLRTQQQKAAELIVGDNESPEALAFTFSLELSMLEIYNDGVYDLLGSAGSSAEDKKQASMDAGGKASLDIRRDKDGRVEIPGLTREVVNSIEDVMHVLKQGNENRAVASTDLNEHSSRSHMVLIVDVISGLNGVPSNRGTLYLVDLAGSERVRKSNVDGAQLREAGFINKSLSALGNVMEALDRKASHVPYRDSKLTYLLQDSLGGNSRTMMIATVCPMDVACDESVQALQFATRVRRIQIGAAQRNVTSKNLEETVKELTGELRSITRAKDQMEGQLQSLKRDNNRIQDRLQNLSQARSQTRSDSRTLEVLRKNNTEMAQRWQKEKRLREEAGDELDKTRKELRRLQQQISKKSREVEQVQSEMKDFERKLEMANRELRQAKEASNAAALRARRAQVLSARNRKTPSSSISEGNKRHNSSRQPPPSSSSVVVHPVPSGDGGERNRESSNHATMGASVNTSNAVVPVSTPSASIGEDVTAGIMSHSRGGATLTDSAPTADATANQSDIATSGANGYATVPTADGVVHGEEREQADINSMDIAEIRENVLRLLEKYDKGKVNRIDIIMEKFKGKEHLLLQKMTQRYEPDGANGAPGPSPSSSIQKRNEMAMERHKERMRSLRDATKGF